VLIIIFSSSLRYIYTGEYKQLPSLSYVALTSH